ncbi:MAG: DUF4239 domain-containing protein [Holophaga sp.]|nr:DUF4239 domain-containing protein [Holophaga sp.]
MFTTAMFALGLFLLLLLLVEVGRRLGIRQVKADPEHRGIGPIEGALFALLGLLIAFTFSGAENRFQARRQLIVQEANAIGTAYLRVDLLPPQEQPRMRENFRQYLDSRLAVYQRLQEPTASHAARARAEALQAEIWGQAVRCAQTASTTLPGMLLLPALNDMIDITTTRAVALQTHPPKIVYGILFGLTLLSALMAGHAMAASRARSWLHILCYAGIMVLALVVIVDFEYPRMGLIRIDAVDQVLVDLRAGMK